MPTPSFKPDQLGLFTLQVSGAKADGTTVSVVVIVEAIDVPVFVRDLHVTNGDPTLAATSTTNTLVAGAYGSAARAIDCPVTTSVDGGDGSNLLVQAIIGTRSGAVSGDSWEGPPGTPSRVALPDIRFAPAGITVGLTVATSTSRCGAAEAKVLDTTFVSANLEVAPASVPNFIFNARFSPDGNRIAYINDVGGSARISTVGFDGAGKRDLSPTTAVGDGSLTTLGATPIIAPSAAEVIGPVTPRWKDPTHVGWVSFTGETAALAARESWELWVVEDKAGAQAERAMVCTGSGLTHFDFLPDGTVIAAVKHPAEAEKLGIMDLVVYRANAATKGCEVVRNLTKYTVDGSIARDFALSPDKSTAAFFAGGAIDPDLGGSLFPILTLLSTVPVNGSLAPAPVPGVTGRADFGVGPRWVGGGTAITWGQVDVSFAPGLPLSRLMPVPVGGGQPIAVTNNVIGALPSGDGGLSVDYHLRFGMGQGCTAAPGPISNGILIAFGLLGGATLIARRRSR
ncbi:MAG: hypothetical protein KF795_00715 [Labilithrix sp.]|nr:hypothetical protein [Labilithrix sp.]